MRGNELKSYGVAIPASEARFQIVRSVVPAEDRRVVLTREVRAGLAQAPRSIPPKYFYDDVGSRLFDAICDLPEYYLTRAERGLLLRYADAIAEATGATTLVEIGSGMARKTGLLLRALSARVVTPTYVPFDIAVEPIVRSAADLLAADPRLRIRGVVGDFMHDCAHLDAAAPPGEGPRLFAFLGSTIGNLDEEEAPRMLRTLAERMTPADRFLLGVDLVKDPRVLHAAYNDSQGVTAAFNQNVLRVVSRELGGDIDPEAFAHWAAYDEERAQIEMRLVAQRAQHVSLPAANLALHLAQDETILTEISRKFTRARVEGMLARGGMQMREWWVEPNQAETSFALCLAGPLP